jgi:hypothetical protein
MRPTLRAGEARRRWAKVPWLFPLALALAVNISLGTASFAAEETPQLQPVEVVFELTMPAQLETAWTLVVTPRVEGSPSIRQPVDGLQPAFLDLPVGVELEISGELPGFWVQRQLLTVTRSDEAPRLLVELWPLGILSGSLRLATQEGELPTEVMVRTMIVPAVLGRPPSPAGVLTCPVDKEGRWSCQLPAGTVDLAIVAAGFTPHYRWGVEVPPLATRKLPPLELRQGASIAGWVAIDGGKIDPESCVARLLPAADRRSDLKQALLSSATAVETKVGGDGFLQFKDLLPGNYALEVRQEGYATKTVDLIQVAARTETFLKEPVILTAPLSLRLEIDPKLDSSGQPWKVRVSSTAGSASNGGRPAMIFDGAADLEGQLTLSDLSPGEIHVMVEDGSGNRIFNNGRQPWTLEESRVERIEIPQVAITGRLLLGDEPLAATLFFGGRSGGERVRVESDEEGSFSGTLPREGFWRVQIQAQQPPLDTMAETEIRARRSGETFVEIELPDNRLFGRVVDAGSLPVERATVVTQGSNPMLFQWKQTDERGRFELRGLAAGAIELGAESDDSMCQAGPLKVTVPEDGEVGPVELRCRKMKPVAGVVVSAQGPAAGVRVELRGLPPALGGGRATTKADGSFAMEVPADLGMATAFLSATGFGAQQQNVDLSEGPLRLTLKEGIGQVEIHLPLSSDDFHRENLRVALFESGANVAAPMQPMQSEPNAENDSASYRVSDLAPGDYAACLVRAPERPFSPPTEGDRLTCATGRLEAGGRLALRVPGPT